MRNMLLALAGLVAITVTSTAMADDAGTVLEETAAQAVEAAPMPEAETLTSDHAMPMEAAPAPQPMPADNNVVYQSAPVYHHHHCCPPQKKKGVIAKLWELEKKKNAWLVRTFFGK